MTNEHILLPVAPHSEGCEFPPQVNAYRGIVEEALVDCLGRHVFFYEAVEMVMGRIAARIEKQNTQATAEACATGAPQGDRAGNGESDGKNMCFAPQSSWIRELADSEARKIRGKIELRFVATGKLEMPPEYCTGRKRS